MKVGQGNFSYEWIDNWACIPDTESGRTNGRTHGIVALDTGDVMIFCQAQPALLRFDSAGKLKNAWGDRFGGAHGMTFILSGDVPTLWLTDQFSAEVVQTTLDGRTILSLQRANLPAYLSGGKYSPTWVAVNEERFGGNGDIWVADGYGSNYVHRYAKSGAYIASINGTEGRAGSFACPHGVAFVPKPDGPELYIADRGNKRCQVYDPDGKFKRSFGADYLNSPCGFAWRDGILYIPELQARLTIIDEEEKVIAVVGENAPACKSPGWPDLAATKILPGKFNSPHAVAVDQTGSVYVVEWKLGGRVTKLAKV